MENLEAYVDRAERCSELASDEGDPNIERYWQSEAQIQATLALVRAVMELGAIIQDATPRP